MVKNKMFEQLEKLTARYTELQHLLADHEQIADRQNYNKLAKELSDIRGPVALFAEYNDLLVQLKFEPQIQELN